MLCMLVTRLRLGRPNAQALALKDIGIVFLAYHKGEQIQTCMSVSVAMKARGLVTVGGINY